MSKKILIPVIILLLAIVFIYLFIPSTIKISAVKHIKCTTNELNTCLRDANKWQQWFPGNKNLYEFEGYQYVEKEQKLNGVDIDIINNKYKLHSSLLGLSLNPDSLMVTWSAEINNGINPMTRIQHYLDASGLERNMNIILDSLKSFASESIHVYGFNIRRTSFDESLLLSTKRNYKMKPDLDEQYNVIYDLKRYIISKGATITDSPMVNMSRENSGFRMQVAISIDHVIEETSEYNLIRMVHINGKYVAADVIGGPEKIQKGHEQIEAFMKDHFLTSPGISFEIYLTDRKKESNPAKWKTRIYYPST